LRELVESGIKWQQDTLGYKTDKQELVKFERNLEIASDLRREELRKLPANGVAMEMAITKSIAREFAF
jgi:hypothetical protein